MIGFNGKYLAAAAIGDMRITAMSQGDKWLIGDWLMSATKAAILSAFGAEEGAGVIQATNAYLNAIAATDREKAQRLANCINEDPMLVCSLGLEVQGFTMPIRWLKSNNGGYFATGKTIISGDVVTFGAMFTSFNTENMFGWREDGQVGVVIFPASNSAWFKAFGGTTSQTDNGITLQTNKAYEFEMSQQGLFVWNNTLQRTSMNMTQVGNAFPNHEYYIFLGGNNGSLDTRTFSGLLSRHQINNGGILRIMFVPKKVNGNWELLDVVSGDYAVRSGSFNMSYTLPDGTPWTPLNEQ